MKKYFKCNNTEKKNGRWSDGFSNIKNGEKYKNNKPNKTDNIEFEDGTVLLIDELAECKGIIGDVIMFSTMGGSLEVNGEKKII